MRKKKFISLLTLLLLTSCGPKAPQIIKYSISYYDNETLIKTEEVEEGHVPSFSYNKPSDDDYDYTFIGWSTSLNGEASELLPASNNTTYYLVYSSNERHYNIQYLDEDTTNNIRSRASSIAYEEFEEILLLNQERYELVDYILDCFNTYCYLIFQTEEEGTELKEYIDPLYDKFHQFYLACNKYPSTIDEYKYCFAKGIKNFKEIAELVDGVTIDETNYYLALQSINAISENNIELFYAVAESFYDSFKESLDSPIRSLSNSYSDFVLDYVESYAFNYLNNIPYGEFRNEFTRKYRIINVQLSSVLLYCVMNLSNVYYHTNQYFDNLITSNFDTLKSEIDARLLAVKEWFGNAINRGTISSDFEELEKNITNLLIAAKSPSDLLDACNNAYVLIEIFRDEHLNDFKAQFEIDLRAYLADYYYSCDFAEEINNFYQAKINEVLESLTNINNARDFDDANLSVKGLANIVTGAVNERINNLFAPLIAQMEEIIAQRKNILQDETLKGIIDSDWRGRKQDLLEHARRHTSDVDGFSESEISSLTMYLDNMFDYAKRQLISDAIDQINQMVVESRISLTPDQLLAVENYANTSIETLEAITTYEDALDKVSGIVSDVNGFITSTSN